MSYANTASRYLDNEVLSRSPEWLVPLLYEHLLGSLKRAEVQIEAGDREGKAASLAKANAIVLELSATLDHEKGAAIAANLASLYAYVAQEIMNVSRSGDTDVLRRLVAMMTELHAAWVQAAEQVAPRGRAGLRSLSAAVA